MAGSAAERVSIIRGSIGRRWKMWLAITAGLTLAYYLALMAALVIKFGNLPNYAVAYNWPANVWKIVVSTPSVSDMIPIIADEWLFEFGYMNYDYGHGISEWALDIVPSKVLVVLALGALTATFGAVLAERRHCSTRTRIGASSATGIGALSVALTSATMSWVVCCATPSWVVGLSMMGLGVSWSLWLQPIGPWVSLAGFVLLALGVFVAASPAKRPRSDRDFANSDRQFLQRGART